MSDRLTILQGDCLEQLATLPEASVQCCVTSPPYWGLRDYGVAGQLGLERTPEEYIEKMVAVFREVRRVLRKDGTCWVNLGDSYTASGAGGDTGKSGLQGSTESQDASKLAKSGQRLGSGSSFRRDRAPLRSVPHKWAPGRKPKDLVGIPWRVALALQADGWWLRCDIIWHKPNPMPESVTDRPTKAHEYLFLLTKSVRYFYDAEAIKEQGSPDTHARISQASLQTQKGGWKSEAYLNNFPGKKSRDRKPADILKAMARKAGVNPKAAHNGANGSKQNESFAAAVCLPVLTRNKRSVWTVATAPYADAHFATFPPDLIKPCILAGTSAAGCCVECGAPFERVVVKGEPDLAHQRACGGDENGEYHGQNTKDYQRHKAQPASTVKERILAGMRKRITTDWNPTCGCEAALHRRPTVPCTVLDPFGGSGTTGAVSIEMGRRAILIELNPDYIALAERRCAITPGLALS